MMPLGNGAFAQRVMTFLGEGSLLNFGIREEK
jgi:hypothetical protein